MLVFALPMTLFIGALILRGAVSLANRSIGRPETVREYFVEDEDDWSDYPVAGREPEVAGGVIPLPGISKAMGILLCTLIVNGIVTFAIQMMVGGEPGPRRRLGILDDAVFLARAANLPITFLFTSGLLAAMLPTTFSRGLLVTFFYFLICLGIVAVFAVPLYLLRL